MEGRAPWVVPATHGVSCTRVNFDFALSRKLFRCRIVKQMISTAVFHGIAEGFGLMGPSKVIQSCSPAMGRSIFH